MSIEIPEQLEINVLIDDTVAKEKAQLGVWKFYRGTYLPFEHNLAQKLNQFRDLKKFQLSTILD